MEAARYKVSDRRDEGKDILVVGWIRTYLELRIKRSPGKAHRKYYIQSRPRTRSEGIEATIARSTFIERNEPSLQGRDKRPEATEAEVAIPEDRTQSRESVEVSRSESNDVESGTLRKVAPGDMVGGKRKKR